MLVWILTSINVSFVRAEKEGFEDPRFNDDWEERAAEVNEGDLNVLLPRPDLAEHHHHSKIIISPQSIDTGWVDMYQCHTHLDSTPALQIVFAKGRVRDLKVVSYKDIARSWVDNYTVQLEDISKDSSICLSLQTWALHAKSGQLILRNGPFMRRFLDGYYPMRVSMHVEYPGNLIHYLSMAPENVPHRVNASDGSLEFDVRFEGKLTTEISFEKLVPEN